MTAYFGSAVIELAKRAGVDVSKVQVFDDGDGPYIKNWPDGVSKPETQSILTMASKIELMENAYVALIKHAQTITDRRKLEAQYDPSLDVGGGKTAATWLSDAYQTLKTLRNTYQQAKQDAGM